MSERLIYGKTPPSSFVEQVNFSRQAPYIIKQKNLVEDDFAIMHYSNSIEIDFCCNCEGYAVISQNKIELSGNKVVIIPPNIVHSVMFKKGNGHVYVLHISLEHLKKYMDIPAILSMSNKTLGNLNYTSDEFDNLLSHVHKLIEDDNNFVRCLAELLRIIDIVSSESPASQLPISIEQNRLLHDVIQYTEQNYMKSISLEDVASTISFSKNYFCSWFKKVSGISYNTYLTEVRITKACLSILETQSAKQTAWACGFSSASYFSNVFGRLVGMSPMEYCRMKRGSE